MNAQEDGDNQHHGQVSGFGAHHLGGAARVFRVHLVAQREFVACGGGQAAPTRKGFFLFCDLRTQARHEFHWAAKRSHFHVHPTISVVHVRLEASKGEPKYGI